MDDMDDIEVPTNDPTLHIAWLTWDWPSVSLWTISAMTAKATKECSERGLVFNELVIDGIYSTAGLDRKQVRAWIYTDDNPPLWESDGSSIRASCDRFDEIMSDTKDPARSELIAFLRSHQKPAALSP